MVKIAHCHGLSIIPPSEHRQLDRLTVIGRIHNDLAVVRFFRPADRGAALKRRFAVLFDPPRAA